VNRLPSAQLRQNSRTCAALQGPFFNLSSLDSGTCRLHKRQVRLLQSANEKVAATHPSFPQVVDVPSRCHASQSWHPGCREIFNRVAPFRVWCQQRDKLKAFTGIRMNSWEMKGNWNVIKGKLRQRWAKLTDDDLQYVQGKENELIGRIQKRTGETRESVRKTVNAVCSSSV
jgi:uncharacterized protein YjbJ (UPF0337 family)